ncbi:MAG: hypothetical protein WA777_21535 [Rhodanobacter sp.]
MVNDLYMGPLKVGDWATLFAGAATFLAVCVAIFIPMWQTRRLRKERLGREARAAQILAIELADVLLRLRRDMIERRPLVQLAMDGKLDGAPANFVNGAKLWGAADLPHGADLQGLPYPIAPSIAALRSNLSMYNESVERALAFVAEIALHESVAKTKVPGVLDGCQSALARVVSHLQRYEPAYGSFDFLDKEDGTCVKKLDDYLDDY